ncbi:MAG: DUF6365 family protein [Rhodothermales bacterium]
MKYLFVALSAKGYGETILGIRVARELHEAGHECNFLVHESALPLLVDTPFRHMKVTDHALGLLKAILLTRVQKSKPDSVILSDYFTTDLAFERARLDPSFLTQLDVPVGMIDTWDMRRSGTTIDVFGNGRRDFDDWSALLDYRLIPVPIAPPGDTKDKYCTLPVPENVHKKVRRHIRRDLGIPPDEPVVLFCTAAWQHARFTSDHGNRLARLLPVLIAQYVARLDGPVHLVHVGPAAFPAELGDRYHWLPSLPPDKFALLLASMDLLVSANVSATTIARALVADVPSVVLTNTTALTDLGELGDRQVSDTLAAWIREAAPIYPFYMWPVGYQVFLQPLLDGNPYCDVVPLLEIFDEETVLASLNGLLFDGDTRARHLERQREYVDQTRQLPTAGHLVSNIISEYV